MSATPISVLCRADKAQYKPGEPVLLRIALRNRTSQPVKLLPAGVPWLYHHAIAFDLLTGTPDDVELQNRLWVLDPPEGPEVVVGAHAAAHGTVDLAKYLYAKDGRNIAALPGSYRLRAHAVVLASVVSERDDYERLELHSRPFTVVIGGEP